MAEITKFKSEDHGIPQDKFDYVVKMLKDNGVTFEQDRSPDNPRLRMMGVQQCEDITVCKLNNNFDGEKINPRQMNKDMFEHFTMTLSTKDTVRVIQTSRPMMVHGGSGKLIPNIQRYPTDKLSKNLSDICRFGHWLYWMISLWEYFVSDDIYLWAESCGCAELLDDEKSYLYDTFNYYKEVVQSFVDIFGYDVIEQAMNDLAICGHCGTEYGASSD